MCWVSLKWYKLYRSRRWNIGFVSIPCSSFYFNPSCHKIKYFLNVFKTNKPPQGSKENISIMRLFHLKNGYNFMTRISKYAMHKEVRQYSMHATMIVMI